MPRLLNHLEHAFWAADQLSPLNFVFVAQLSGSLTLERLRGSLHRQLRRYPCLSMTILDSEADGPQLVKASIQPRIDVIAGGGWKGQLSSELNTPFDCPTEPICRLKWVRSDDDSHVLMTFHHSVLDGRSGLRIFQSLIEDASALVAGTPLDPKIEPVRLWQGHIQTDSRPSQLRYGHGIERWTLGSRPLAERRMGAVAVSLDETETSTLIRRARTFGTSLTALFGAAHLLALAAHFGRAGLYSLSMPVDWRDRAPDVGTDALGLLVGEGRVVYRLSARDELWSLARRMTGDIERLAPVAPPHHVTSAHASDLKDVYGRRASTALSNLGRIDGFNLQPPLRVDDLFMAVSCGVFGDQIMTLLTHQNRINALFCVAVPTVSPPSAEAIADLTRARLTDAIGPLV
ncbi:MAG: condensation domain-containing protein [Myxococcota bacterium]|nr:condensation domain-containing protein [Myxococcota bacterium]